MMVNVATWQCAFTSHWPADNFRRHQSPLRPERTRTSGPRILGMQLLGYPDSPCHVVVDVIVTFGIY